MWQACKMQQFCITEEDVVADPDPEAPLGLYPRRSSASGEATSLVLHLDRARNPRAGGSATSGKHGLILSLFLISTPSEMMDT